MRLIQIAAFLFSIVIFSSCGERTCADVKFGKFHIADYGHEHIIIEREGNVQYEYSEKEGFKHEYRVIWEDDCHYKLVFKESTNPELLGITEQDTFHVSVESVNEDGYQYRGIIGEKEFVGHIKEFKNN